MSETMTPQEAAATIASTTRWEGSLARRVEGLTWMVWGIAMPGMFVSYGFADALGASDLVMALLWIPWVALANVVTIALWRTAALTARAEIPTRRSKRWLLLGAVYLVVFALMNWLSTDDTWVTPMVLIGVVWSLLGLLIPRMSAQGRVVSAVVGVSVALAAVGVAALPLGEHAAGAAATAAIALIPLGGGLWQVLRG